MANKYETMKAEKDGLDILPDILRWAEEGTTVDAIEKDDLQRTKWYGAFHRDLTPGYFMMRLRIPGGRLTTLQLSTIASISADFGRATADLTTRQNIQLRWLTIQDLPEVWRRLESVGLTSQQTGLDNARNFIGCPLAGIDGLELIDTTDLFPGLAEAYLGLKEYSNLPRKFNIALAGCREDCGHAQTQDMGLVPATARVDGVKTAGFNVLIGGALGGKTPRLATPLDAFILPGQVKDLFTALMRIFRDHGDREVRNKGRFKFLVDHWGEEKLRAEVERELGYTLPRAGTDERLRTAGDHLGVREQRQVGLNYVGLHVPVGRTTADDLYELADLADQYGGSEVRLTVGQNVIIPHIPDANLDALLAEPLLERMQPKPSSVWRNLVACTGNDFCNFSLIDTKKHAIEIATELENRGVEVASDTRIHISGCVHACGKHHVGDIGLRGQGVRIDGEVVEGADIYAGGTLGPDARLATLERTKVPMTEIVDQIIEFLPVLPVETPLLAMPPAKPATVSAALFSTARPV